MLVKNSLLTSQLLILWMNSKRNSKLKKDNNNSDSCSGHLVRDIWFRISVSNFMNYSREKSESEDVSPDENSTKISYHI